MENCFKIYEKKKIKNENKLVRQAIEDLIGLSIADAKRKDNVVLPKEYVVVYEFYTSLKKELKAYPKILKKIDEFFKIWQYEFLDYKNKIYNKKLYEAGKIWGAFREHKPKGRPKAGKRRRGKPRTFE